MMELEESASAIVLCVQQNQDILVVVQLQELDQLALITLQTVQHHCSFLATDIPNYQVLLVSTILNFVPGKLDFLVMALLQELEQLASMILKIASLHMLTMVQVLVVFLSLFPPSPRFPHLNV